MDGQELVEIDAFLDILDEAERSYRHRLADDHTDNGLIETRMRQILALRTGITAAAVRNDD